MDEAIKHIIIINRKLGCDDESASDDEQLEKVLYFYPENTNDFTRISKANLLEGLVDFSRRFSNQSFDAVVMSDHTWGGYELQDDYWLFVCFRNPTHVMENSVDSIAFTHQVNTVAINMSLKNFARFFEFLYGNIDNILNGFIDHGVEIINKVREVRKFLRKIKIRQRQEQQDLETLKNRVNIEDHNNEYIGVKEDFKTLEQVEKEIKQSEEAISENEDKLEKLLMDSSYTPKILRSILCRFVKYYLSNGLFTSSSLFDSLDMIHYYPLHVENHLKSPLLRIQESIQRHTRGAYRGAAIIYDGQLIWTDLDDETTLNIYQFVKTNEIHSFQQQIKHCLETFSSTQSNPFPTEPTAADFEDYWTRNLLHQDSDTHRGFYTTHSVQTGNQLKDMEEIIFNADKLNTFLNNQFQSTLSLSEPLLSGFSYVDPSLQTTNILVDHQFGPDCIFCPRIYSTPTKVLHLKCSDIVSMGRALFYKQGRFVVCVVISDWDPLHETGPSCSTDILIKSLLAIPKYSNILLRLLDDSMTEDMKTKCVMNYIRSNRSCLIEETGESLDLDALHQYLGFASLLNLCSMFQQGLGYELSQYNGLLASSSGLFHGADIHLRSTTTTTSTTTSARMIRNSTNKSSSFKRIDNLSSGESSHRLMASLSSRKTSDAHLMSPYQSLALIQFQCNLSSTSAELTAAAAMLPVRGIRAILYNTANSSTKICNVYKGDVNHLLLYPKNFCDALFAPPANESTAEPKEKVRHGLIQSLSHKIAMQHSVFNFPIIPSVLLMNIEPTVLRALNDLWIELTGHNDSSKHKMRSTIEGHIRVSTMQRGGLWVAGRKLFHGNSEIGLEIMNHPNKNLLPIHFQKAILKHAMFIKSRYVILVIDRCATFHDMYEIFAHFCDTVEQGIIHF